MGVAGARGGRAAPRRRCATRKFVAEAAAGNAPATEMEAGSYAETVVGTDLLRAMDDLGLGDSGDAAVGVAPKVVSTPMNRRRRR